MKSYLTIMRKYDFTDLFNFGYLFIDAGSVVEFNGDIADLKNNASVRDALSQHLNQFDYSFTVLVVHFKSEHIKNDGKINIEELQNIFALDDEAKREIKITFDPRIILNDPIWPDLATELQERFLYEDARKGVQNIWKILKIEKPVSDYESILPDRDLREIVYEVQNDIRPAGDLSFWVYLLRYERHAFFPGDAMGFFMDIINVFINAAKQKEFTGDEIEGTNIFRRLPDFKDKQLKAEALLLELEKTQEGKIFFDKLNAAAHHASAVQIAMLFLIFRRIFSNGFDISKNKKNREMLRHYEKLFPAAYYFSLYLLGIYLGYRHTCDCLYDILHLPILRPQSCGNAGTECMEHVNTAPPCAINENAQDMSSPESPRANPDQGGKDNTTCREKVETKSDDCRSAANNEDSARSLSRSAVSDADQQTLLIFFEQGSAVGNGVLRKLIPDYGSAESVTLKETAGNSAPACSPPLPMLPPAAGKESKPANETASAPAAVSKGITLQSKTANGQPNKRAPGRPKRNAEMSQALLSSSKSEDNGRKGSESRQKRGAQPERQDLSQQS